MEKEKKVAKVIYNRWDYEWYVVREFSNTDGTIIGQCGKYGIYKCEPLIREQNEI